MHDKSHAKRQILQSPEKENKYKTEDKPKRWEWGQNIFIFPQQVKEKRSTGEGMMQSLTPLSFCDHISLLPMVVNVFSFLLHHHILQALLFHVNYLNGECEGMPAMHHV